MIWRACDAAAGDLVRIRIGSIYHYGVFVSEDEVIEFGEAPVSGLRRDDSAIRVIAVDADEFACGHIVEVAVLDKKERRERIPPKKTVERARSRLGEGGYNLLHNNCEHFATECVFGAARCEQEEEARRRWLSRPILDVYVARVDDSAPVGSVASKKRQKEIDSVKNPRVRREKYAVWKLLEFAAKESFRIPIDDVVFTKNRSGKWTADKFHFSLTHTDGFVAVAVSNAPVGVDAETLASFAEKTDAAKLGRLCDYVCTEAEKSRVNSAADFIDLWTKKESVFKLSGDRSFIPSRIAVDDFITYTGSPAGADSLRVSVCTPDASHRPVFYIAADGVKRLTAFG